MGLEKRAQAEGDVILQMLLWLDRTPESFVAGSEGASADRFRLPKVGEQQVLCWDARALHSALDARRQQLGMTWQDIALRLGEFTPEMLTNLARGGRVGFPRVMRVVRWLDQPAASFTRAANR
jgi:hypothetical protein